MDAFDVHTDGERYWVITQPTNLYSQRFFPSLDYTITFHVGVTARMMATRKATSTDQQQDRLAAAWRRWTQAAESLDAGDEAEEFKAVAPKAAAFIAWSELIADATASAGRE